MPLRTALFICVLILIAGGLGWLYFTKPTTITPTQQVIATPPPVVPTPEPVTEEDIAKLFAVPVTIAGAQVSTASGMMEFIQLYEPGFVTLFGASISSRAAQATVATLKSIGDGDVGILVDHEGGRVQRLSGPGFTKLPSWQAICAQKPVDRAALFTQTASELQQAGISVVLGPVVDLTASGSALRDRTCSSDPLVTAAVVQELIVAYRQKGLYPVLKHYPGIGATTRDLHTELDALDTRPLELPVFASLLRIFPSIGVMTTHVLVTEIAEDAPCSLSVGCVGQLRQQAPQALIFTDALDMESARTGYDLLREKSLLQVTREALLAGNHVLVYGVDVPAADLTQVLQELAKEYQYNQVLRERIDAALMQVRATKQDAIY